MKRWFTLLLALALCCAPVAGALAEEEIPLTEVPMEAVEVDLAAEGSAPAEEALGVEPAFQTFSPFYVRVLPETLPVYAEVGGTEPFAVLSMGDVALAVEPAGESRQKLAYNDAKDGVVSGFVASDALQAMTFEELNAYVAGFAGNVQTLYDGDINYPLAALEGRSVQPANEEQTEVEFNQTEQTEVANDAEATEVSAPDFNVESEAGPAPELAEGLTLEVAAGPEAETQPETQPEDGEENTGDEPAVVIEEPKPLTDFTLPANLSLGVKENFALLTPALVPENAAASFTWRSSKPKIVEVNASTGALVAKKKGTAVITAASDNGIEKSCTVTVLKAPKAVALSESRVVLMGGDQAFQLVATLTKNTAATVYYESTDPSVAVVSPSGLVTSVAPGSATVTARIFNGKTASCAVRVLDPTVPQPARIDLPAQITIGEKQVALIAPVMYSTTGENLGASEFTLESSAPKKLKAAADGTITGVKKGDYTVTVTAYNGITATCKVHVDKAPSKVAFVQKTPILGVGQTRQLTVTFPKGGTGTVSFTSANPGVLTVDANGYVTGVSVGSAVVTVRTHNGKTAKVTVKVTKSPEYVGLNAEYGLEYDRVNSTYTTLYSVSLNPGESFQLACEMEYGANGDVAAYESKDAAVATVTASGLITAVGSGETTVVVRATGGAETLCRVKVSGAEPAAVWFEAAEATLTVGEVQAMPALAGSDPEALAGAVYESDNPEVLTVAYSEESARWELTGVAPGTACLTAAVLETTARLKVTVLPAVPEATTPTYRLFAAYGYYNPDYRGYIPFTENNAKSLASTFENSSISGLTYTTKVMGNPTKTSLLSGISSFFAGTTDADVSIVYLCSHGHMTNGYAGYRMSLPGYDDSPTNANYYMSAQEIFNCVSRIRGSVVLIVDSCYSGAFLQDMTGQLEAQGGRIAVMTAASDTRATYYNVKNTAKSVDFFTFFLLKGLGYNHRDKWWNSNAAGKKGAYPGYLAADQAGNKDGIVTLGEFYEYASQSIAANIPNYMKKSWYWGDKTRVQVPRFYAGNLADLVIYQPR